MSTQEFGGLTAWLLHVLNVLTGNLDRAGGSMFPNAAIDLVEVALKTGQKGSHGSFQSRVRGLPELRTHRHDRGRYPAARPVRVVLPEDRRVLALVEPVQGLGNGNMVAHVGETTVPVPRVEHGPVLRVGRLAEPGERLELLRLAPPERRLRRLTRRIRLRELVRLRLRRLNRRLIELDLRLTIFVLL